MIARRRDGIRRRPGRRGCACQGKDLVRYSDLVAARTTTEFFDFSTVAIAGWKVLVRINGGWILPQQGFDNACLLDKFRPVFGGQQPETGDSVSYRDLVDCLSLLPAAHQFDRCRAPAGQRCFQPVKPRRVIRFPRINQFQQM